MKALSAFLAILALSVMMGCTYFQPAEEPMPPVAIELPARTVTINVEDQDGNAFEGAVISIDYRNMTIENYIINGTHDIEIFDTAPFIILTCPEGTDGGFTQNLDTTATNNFTLMCNLQPREVLAGIFETGMEFDITTWGYRKSHEGIEVHLGLNPDGSVYLAIIGKDRETNTEFSISHDLSAEPGQYMLAQGVVKFNVTIHKIEKLYEQYKASITLQTTREYFDYGEEFEINLREGLLSRDTNVTLTMYQIDGKYYLYVTSTRSPKLYDELLDMSSAIVETAKEENRISFEVIKIDEQNQKAVIKATKPVYIKDGEEFTLKENESIRTTDGYEIKLEKASQNFHIIRNEATQLEETEFIPVAEVTVSRYNVPYSTAFREYNYDKTRYTMTSLSTNRLFLLSSHGNYTNRHYFDSLFFTDERNVGKARVFLKNVTGTEKNATSNKTVTLSLTRNDFIAPTGTLIVPRLNYAPKESINVTYTVDDQSQVGVIYLVMKNVSASGETITYHYINYDSANKYYRGLFRLVGAFVLFEVVAYDKAGNKGVIGGQLGGPLKMTEDLTIPV
ncbi:MAG: hypothetical protein J4432_04895 [DPANN group archaeon]|nr:hypothetical protein [DPANN group archaeon]